METITASLNGQDVLIQDEMAGGAAVSAWLLGLSLDEFGSRTRHTKHPPREMPPHVHVHSTTDDAPHMHLHRPPVTEAPTRNHTQDLADMKAGIGFVYVQWDLICLQILDNLLIGIGWINTALFTNKKRRDLVRICQVG